MCNNPILLLVLTVLTSAAPGALRKESKPVQRRSITVCETLEAPLMYDGVIVSLRGRLFETDEGSWLIADDCPHPLVTEGYSWPPQIYLSLPNSPSRVRLHSPSFRFDERSGRKINQKIRRLRTRFSNECIEVTFTGMFETYRDWSAALRVQPKGQRRWSGFGHLSDAPGQLLLRSEDAVSVKPSCLPANSQSLRGRPGSVDPSLRRT